MRDLLLRLIDVQHYDSQIADLTKGSKNLPAQLTADQEKLKEARSQVNTLEDEIKLMEVQRRELDAVLKMEAAKVKKWEARLNDIRNQREYVALSREIEAAKRANKDTEDRVIELMEMSDEKGKLLDALRDDLAVLEVDYNQLREEVEAKLAVIEKSVAQIGSERDTKLEGIPERVLKQYQRIRDKRAGIAIVPVVDGQCQGCFMAVQPQLFNTLMRMTTFETCPYCYRIIYWSGLTQERQDEAGEAASAT